MFEILNFCLETSNFRAKISDFKLKLANFGAKFTFLFKIETNSSFSTPRLFTLVINAGYDTLVFYNGTLSRANISFGCTEVQYKYCLFFLLLLKKVTRF